MHQAAPDVAAHRDARSPVLERPREILEHASGGNRRRSPTQEQNRTCEPRAARAKSSIFSGMGALMKGRSELLGRPQRHGEGITRQPTAALLKGHCLDHDGQAAAVAGRHEPRGGS